MEGYLDQWYKLLWEYDDNGKIPQGLKEILDSKWISECVIISRNAPNKNMIVWKVNVNTEEKKIKEKILSSVNCNL